MFTVGWLGGRQGICVPVQISPLILQCFGAVGWVRRRKDIPYCQCQGSNWLTRVYLENDLLGAAAPVPEEIF